MPRRKRPTCAATRSMLPTSHDVLALLGHPVPGVHPLYGLGRYLQAIFLFFNLLTACLLFYLPYRKGCSCWRCFPRLSGCSIAGRCTYP